MEKVKFYRVLWIDDEHNEMGGFKGRAKRNGINLTPFKSLSEGMSELEQNYSLYDGVLLDAKFLENENDVKGSEDTKYIHKAKERLFSLKKKFEPFVLTGQAEAFEDKTFRKVFENVYHKGDDEQTELLFLDLKRACDNQLDTQIRHKFRRVFDVCTSKYLGEELSGDILSLLKRVEENSINDNFNLVRKVVEDFFIACQRFDLLPGVFVEPNVALNQSSRFLSGHSQHKDSDEKFKRFECKHAFQLPKQISRNLKFILDVTQSGSHRSSIDEHVQLLKTPYLFKSTVYQLIDLILWFKVHIDTIPKERGWIENISETKADENTEYLFGKIINHHHGGFAFFQPDGSNGNRDDNYFIPADIMSSSHASNGMSVKVKVEKVTQKSDGRQPKVTYLKPLP